ncbi:hypothetical protein [Azospirillum sp. sgz301742]
MSTLPHSPSALLDRETVEAIQVLTDAVRRERVPGVVEFRQLERALEQAAEQATEEHLAEAASAFRALDGDFQTRIITRAHTLARTVVEQRHAPAAASETPAAAPASAPKAPAPRASRVQGASPFLAALNQSRPRG